jgi:hypothetical protein
MLTLGFMTLNLNNEHSYFTEIAKRSSKYDIICYRFIPTMINPRTETIEGEEFDCNQERWIPQTFSIPNILYDRCFYGEDFHSKKCKSIVEWLKAKERVHFLGFGLPNKMELYQALSQSKLSPYVPKTVPVSSPEMIYKLLGKMKRMIIKPINGSQGNGVYFIEKHGKQLVVKTDKKEQQITRTFVNETQFLSWVTRILNKREFLLQPYLPLVNDLDQPYDIRSLLQKDKEGNWRVMGKGIRHGKSGGIISNMSAGGEVTDFSSWLKTIHYQKRAFMMEEINDILQNLPPILEKHFPPLFELGVDIGISRDNSIWILDTNSKPGRKVMLELHPELAEELYESPLIYANTLKERGYVLHEKTLPNRSHR